MTQKLRSFLLFFALPAAAAVGACDCAGNPPVTPPPLPVEDCSTMADGTVCAGGICCGGSCESTTATCDPGFECTGAATCSAGTVECSQCDPLPPLARGRMADDLDSTVQADGTFVMTGYSPGDPQKPSAGKYGDLVVGTYDATTATVDWEIVDGVPASGTITGGLDGWRGGNSTAGDDVGRYSSVEANGDDLVVVYADDTNGSLKAAARVGGIWSVHDVDPNAGAQVKWTSMALDGAGLPIVSYLVLTMQDAATQVKPQMSLRIARPTTALPATDGTWIWSHEQIAGGEMGCHVDLCADGFTCITEGTCAPDAGTGDCAADCGNETCFNGACYQTKKASDYLVANGQFTDIEAIPGGGFGLVYYDRTAGKIWGQRCITGSCTLPGDWEAPFQIDGFGSTRPGAGDCGIGASLFIDAANTWHVTYVDGTSEELWYARLPGGTSPTYELVDDGTGSMTGLTRPQKSYVGDDSAVVAVDIGAGEIEVRVAYGDVTLHTTVLATRAPAGGWTHEELPAPTDGEASFSITQADAGGDVSYVGSEWYQVPSAATNDVYLSDTSVFPNPAPVVATDGGI